MRKIRIKARKDAPLKSLPRENQEELVTWCETPKSEGCVGGYGYAKDMLAQQGLKSSVSAIGRFYRWFSMREHFSHAHEMARTQEELMREFDPEDAVRARKYGEYTFIQAALDFKDSKLFQLAAAVTDDRRLRELREQIEPQKLALAERRVRVHERRLGETSESTFQPLLTPEARLAKMRELFGISE